MARRRRGGLGGIIVIFAGIGLIGQFVGEKEPTRPEPTSVSYNPPREDRSKQPAVVETPTQVDVQPKVQVERAPQPSELRSVKGTNIAFRSGPGTSFTVLDRFGRGRMVELLHEEGGWSNVRDKITLRSGWIASRYLVSGHLQKNRPDPGVAKRDDPVVVAKPTISDSQIVQLMIEQSIASYAGPCACPFNRDRRGRRCGGRSAYSRPGGESPLCFVQDVSASMIQAYRARQ